MAFIQSFIDKIRTAQEGKEVRGSLADGINAINKEVESTTSEQKSLFQMFKNLVINAGSSNAEIAASRGTTDWLPDRLDNADAQLETTQKKVDKGIICFTYDDGYSEDNLTYSIFKEFNLPCSFALIKDRVIGQSDIDNYRQWQDEGYSIMSHSANHTQWGSGTNVSKDTVTYEFKSSYDDLVAFGFQINGWVTPYSEMGDEYISELRKYYKYAFTKYAVSLNVTTSAHMNKSQDPMRMHRVSLYANTIDKIKQAIDNCIKESGLLVFYDHRTGYTGSSTEEKLREVLTYVKEKVNGGDCVVLNSDDAVNRFLGVSYKEHTLNISDVNAAPSITDIKNTASLTSWYFPNSSAGVAVSANNGSFDYTGLRFDNGMAAGSQTFEFRHDLTRYDMSKFKNLNQIIGFDLKSSVVLEDLEISLEVRFRDAAGNIDATHRKVVNVGTNWLNQLFVATPRSLSTLNNALCYLRITAKKAISDAFVVYLANPFIGIGVVPARKNEWTPEVSDAIQLRLNATTAYIYKAWIPFSATIGSGSVTENDYLKVYSDASCTFEAKKNGNYFVQFNGSYRTQGALGTGQNGRLILEINKVSFAGDAITRTVEYYNADSRFTMSNAYIFKCKKGDKIYAKLFFDDNQGTLSELVEKPILKVNYMG